MATQYIQIQNNFIQFDNAVYGTQVTDENGIPVIDIYKLADGSIVPCRIYNGTMVYWKIPPPVSAITAFLTGTRVLLT